MFKKIIAVMLFAISTSSFALPAGKVVEMCSAMSDLGGIIVEARDNRTPIQEVASYLSKEFNYDEKLVMFFTVLITEIYSKNSINKSQAEVITFMACQKFVVKYY